jgi:prepilin-type N-terminal cleavage/methylation domain-containing protein
MKNKIKGFTLIELLVVIAIIGILSAIVLASLNTARQKGVNAQIEADLSELQSQASIDYDSFASPGSYGTSTPAFTAAQSAWGVTGTGAPGTGGVGILGATAAALDTSASNALNQISTDNSNKLQWIDTGTAYVVEAALTPAGTGNWCVDSTGASKAEPAATLLVSTSVACP